MSENKYKSEFAEVIDHMPGGPEILRQAKIQVVGAASEEDRKNFKFIKYVPRVLFDLNDYNWYKYPEQIRKAMKLWLKNAGYADIPKKYQDIFDLIDAAYARQKEIWERDEKVRIASLHMPLKTGILDWYLSHGGSVYKLAGVEAPQPTFVVKSRFSDQKFTVDEESETLNAQPKEVVEEERGESTMRFMNNTVFVAKKDPNRPEPKIKPKYLGPDAIIPQRTATKTAAKPTPGLPIVKKDEEPRKETDKARLTMTGREGILPEMDIVCGNTRFNASQFVDDLNTKTRPVEPEVSSDTVVVGTVVEPKVESEPEATAKVDMAEVLARLEKLEAENKQLKADNAAKEAENKQLHLQLGQLQAEHNVLKSEKVDADESKAQLDSVVETGDAAIVSLLSQLNTKDAVIASFKDDMIEKDNTIAKQHVELELRRAKGDVSEDTQEVIDLRNENAELKAENAKLENEYQMLCNEAEKTVEQKDTEIAELQKQFAASQAENAQLKAAAAPVATGDFASNERVDAIEGKLDRVIGLLEKQSAPVVDLTQLTTVVAHMATVVEKVTTVQQPTFDFEKFVEVQSSMINKIFEENRKQNEPMTQAFCQMMAIMANLGYSATASTTETDSAKTQEKPTSEPSVEPTPAAEPTVSTPAEEAEPEAAAEVVVEPVVEEPVTEESTETVTGSVTYTVDGETETIEVEVLGPVDTCETTVADSMVGDTDFFVPKGAPDWAHKSMSTMKEFAPDFL